MADEQAEAGGRPAAAIPLTKAMTLLGMQGALFTAAGVSLWLWSGRPLADLVTVSWRDVAIGLGFGGGLILTAALLFRGFPKISEHLVRLQSETYRFLGGNLGWPAIVGISLIAGISEEVSLRGGLQTMLGDHVGAPAAIAIASALFAALHLAKPLITALLFGVGLLFGAVYWYTGSLLGVIIAHVLYDIWALRYLTREMHRLDLFGEPFECPGPLANHADPG